MGSLALCSDHDFILGGLEHLTSGIQHKQLGIEIQCAAKSGFWDLFRVNTLPKQVNKGSLKREVNILDAVG